jgi:hypothetical protein
MAACSRCAAFMAATSSWMNHCGVALPHGRPFGVEGRGRPLEFRLLHVMEFSERGEISRENVWVDMAAILRQLPAS